jgi:hypothetical protein
MSDAEQEGIRIPEPGRMPGLLVRRRVWLVVDIIVFGLESNGTGVAGSAITSQRLLKVKRRSGLPGLRAGMPA